MTHRSYNIIEWGDLSTTASVLGVDMDASVDPSEVMKWRVASDVLRMYSGCIEHVLKTAWWVWYFTFVMDAWTEARKDLQHGQDFGESEE